jgi:hypothetical protein
MSVPDQKGLVDSAQMRKLAVDCFGLPESSFRDEMGQRFRLPNFSPQVGFFGNRAANEKTPAVRQPGNNGE